MMLSPHFSLAELTVTSTGLKNFPDSEEHMTRLKIGAYVLECVRMLCDNTPVIVTSGYRNRTVNAKVGGVSNSDHCEAWAYDFKVKDFGTLKAARLIAASCLVFDQLILERNDTLIHLSINPRARRQLLRQPGGPGTPFHTLKL